MHPPKPTEIEQWFSVTWPGILWYKSTVQKRAAKWQTSPQYQHVLRKTSIDSGGFCFKRLDSLLVYFFTITRPVAAWNLLSSFHEATEDLILFQFYKGGTFLTNVAVGYQPLTPHFRIKLTEFLSKYTVYTQHHFSSQAKWEAAVPGFYQPARKLSWDFRGCEGGKGETETSFSLHRRSAPG